MAAMKQLNADFNCIREFNSCYAEDLANAPNGPLCGVPIVIKDNVATVCENCFSFTSLRDISHSLHFLKQTYTPYMQTNAHT
jgi:hypothetical protein